MVPFLIGANDVGFNLPEFNGVLMAIGSSDALQGVMLALITLILVGLGLRCRHSFRRAPVNHFSLEISRQRRLRRLQRSRRQFYGW